MPRRASGFLALSSTWYSKPTTYSCPLAGRSVRRFLIDAFTRSSNFCPRTWAASITRSCMRYFTPLLPPGEIFQSNSISKSWKVSSVNRSSSILGCGNDLIQPSSMVTPSPGGDFLAGSSQPANDVPSKSRRHPAAFSLAVSWLSAAKPAMTAAAQASAVILKTRSMAAVYHSRPCQGAGLAHKRSIISNDRKVHPRNPCSCRPPHWRLVAPRPVRPAADYYRFLPPVRCPGRLVLPATCHHWRPLLDQRHPVEHN